MSRIRAMVSRFGQEMVYMVVALDVLRRPVAKTQRFYGSAHTGVTDSTKNDKLRIGLGKPGLLRDCVF